MKIQKTLAEFKKKIDKEIEKYFDKVIKEAERKDLLSAEALTYVKKMTLTSGKRLRPALMYFGYLGAGGKEKEKIIKAAVSIELIHMFLLIHDDIIDRDTKRHGVDSMHYYFSKYARKNFPKKDADHFGDSMAIIIGDMLEAYGKRVILESGFSDRLVIKTLAKLQEIIVTTGMGQSKDIHMEHKGSAEEKEILKMYEYKTAKYSIEGPLHLGMLLAGAGEKDQIAISQYAVPIGIAFQIQDDILGIFGSEKKLGKSVKSDIEEGKQTLLLAKALEKADHKQKKELERIINRGTIDNKDVRSFQRIMIGTGALEYANDLAKAYIESGKKSLKEVKLDRDAKDFLMGIADYMITRSR